MKIGVLGAGTMGAGIAQVAAQSGHDVVLVDLNQDVLNKAKENLTKILNRLVEKNKITANESTEIQGRFTYSIATSDFKDCGMIIEAIVENIDIKHKVFKELESIVTEDCILASNTSSLPIASIGSVLKNSSRIIGIHFFNPAPLMPLVEIIPAVQTSQQVVDKAQTLIQRWKKQLFFAKTLQDLLSTELLDRSTEKRFASMKKGLQILRRLIGQ